MPYISLYRKWRPQFLSQLVGQEHVSRTLTNAIEQGRIAHAYLFSGPRGTGKTSTAKILAKSVNCQKGPTTTPCQECSSCLAISSGASLDVVEIDAASNRGINEIRELIDKVGFSPAESRKKVYIIDEVHMLTNEASNAFLKTLEEPPEHIIFILATTEPSKILPTIISRCQRFDFRLLSLKDISSHLAKIAKQEKLKISSSAIELIAKQARGSLRDALGILEQLASFSQAEIGVDQVAELLSLTNSEKLFEALEIIVSGETARVFELSTDLVNEGRDLRQFIKELLTAARNLLIVKSNSHLKNLQNLTKEEKKRFKYLASQISLESLEQLLDRLSIAYSQVGSGTNPQIVFEVNLIQAMKPPAPPPEELLKRIERLEASKLSPSSTKTDTKKLKRKLSLKRLLESWAEILNEVKSRRLSTYALLIECLPRNLVDGCLTLEFPKSQKFHYQKFQDKGNLAVLEQVILQLLGAEVSINCVLRETEEVEPGADLGATTSSDSNQGNSVASLANQTESQPLSTESDVVALLKSSFGAKIVEDRKKEEL